MTASRSYFQGTLHVLLAANIGKVEVVLILLLVEFASCVNDSRLKHRGSGKQFYYVKDVFHAVNFEVVDHSSLAFVLLRHNQSPEFLLPRLYGNRQCALYRLQVSVKSQLSYHHKLVEHVACYGSACRQNANGKRQVERASLLSEVGRSKVDGNVAVRKLISIELNGRCYAVATLSYCRVAKSRHAIHHTGDNVHFNSHSGHIKAVHSSRISLYEHNSKLDLKVNI